VERLRGEDQEGGVEGVAVQAVEDVHDAAEHSVGAETQREEDFDLVDPLVEGGAVGEDHDLRTLVEQLGLLALVETPAFQVALLDDHFHEHQHERVVLGQVPVLAADQLVQEPQQQFDPLLQGDQLLLDALLQTLHHHVGLLLRVDVLRVDHRVVLVAVEKQVHGFDLLEHGVGLGQRGVRFAREPVEHCVVLH